MTIQTGPYKYAAAMGDNGFAGTFQDIFVITGNNTTNVHVNGIGFSSTQNTDEFLTIIVYKRSTANTGGTATNALKVPLNSNYPDSSTTVKYYTAPPTYGTVTGILWSGEVMSNDPTPTSDVGGFSGIILNCQNVFGASIDLLSPNESIGIGLVNVAAPGGLYISAYFSWSESYK